MIFFSSFMTTTIFVTLFASPNVTINGTPFIRTMFKQANYKRSPKWNLKMVAIIKPYHLITIEYLWALCAFLQISCQNSQFQSTVWYHPLISIIVTFSSYENSHPVKMSLNYEISSNIKFNPIYIFHPFIRIYWLIHMHDGFHSMNIFECEISSIIWCHYKISSNQNVNKIFV